MDSSDQQARTDLLAVVSFVSNAYVYRMQRRIRRLRRLFHRTFRSMRPTPTAIREYDTLALAGEMTETATFGMGCFWGPDAQFGALDGVVRTRVGYAGGTTVDPTYHSLGDHTEVFQLDFDPDVVSYTDLLGHVFRSHDPRSQTRKTQYQNIVLTETAAQQKALEAFLQTRGLSTDAIDTRIERLSQFYLAEEYHQKYTLRSKRTFMDAFEELRYDDTQLRESPAAAKLNGYASGHDTAAVDELKTAGAAESNGV